MEKRKFKCIEDYRMNPNDTSANMVAFKKGKVYEFDSKMKTKSEIHESHDMRKEPDFDQYFELISDGAEPMPFEEEPNSDDYITDEYPTGESPLFWEALEHFEKNKPTVSLPSANDEPICKFCDTENWNWHDPDCTRPQQISAHQCYKKAQSENMSDEEHKKLLVDNGVIVKASANDGRDEAQKLLEKDNDISIVGNCANCGVEYHIHNLSNMNLDCILSLSDEYVSHHRSKLYSQMSHEDKIDFDIESAKLANFGEWLLSKIKHGSLPTDRSKAEQWISVEDAIRVVKSNFDNIDKYKPIEVEKAYLRTCRDLQKNPLNK